MLLLLLALVLPAAAAGPRVHALRPRCWQYYHLADDKISVRFEWIKLRLGSLPPFQRVS